MTNRRLLPFLFVLALPKLCGATSITYGNSTYLLVNSTAIGWTQANEVCANKGGTLARLSSRDLSFIGAALLADGDVTSAWIGAYLTKWNWHYVEREIQQAVYFADDKNNQGPQKMPRCGGAPQFTAVTMPHDCRTHLPFICQYDNLDAASCQSKPAWHRHNKLCFSAHSSALSWYDAAHSCHVMGGYLVKLSDPQLHTTLVKAIQASGVSNSSSFWTCITDNAWQWTLGKDAGESLRWYDWLPGTPVGEGQCVALVTHDRGVGWRNIDCALALPSLCQLPISDNRVTVTTDSGGAERNVTSGGKQVTVTSTPGQSPTDEDAATSLLARCKVKIAQSPPSSDFSLSLSSLTNAQTSPYLILAFIVSLTMTFVPLCAVALCRYFSSGRSQPCCHQGKRRVIDDDSSDTPYVDAAEFLADSHDVRARPPMPPAFPPPPPPDMLANLSELDLPEGSQQGQGQGQDYQNHGQQQQQLQGGYYPHPPNSSGYNNPAMEQQQHHHQMMMMQQMRERGGAADSDNGSQETGGDVMGGGDGSDGAVQYSFFDARQNALLVPQPFKVKGSGGGVTRAASFTASLPRHQHQHLHHPDTAAYKDMAAVLAAAMAAGNSSGGGGGGVGGGSYSYGQLANYY